MEIHKKSNPNQIQSNLVVDWIGLDQKLLLQTGLDWVGLKIIITNWIGLDWKLSLQTGLDFLAQSNPIELDWIELDFANPAISEYFKMWGLGKFQKVGFGIFQIVGLGNVSKSGVLMLVLQEKIFQFTLFFTLTQPFHFSTNLATSKGRLDYFGLDKLNNSQF